MRARPGRAFVISASALLCVAAAAANATERKVVVNEPTGTIGIFSRPTIADTKLIETIANLGAAQIVSFPAGADVTRFVVDKCGQPSAGLIIHPTFEKILLDRNREIGLTRSDLSHLPQPRKLVIPACAPFAPKPAPIIVFNGINGLNQNIGPQVDYAAFSQAVRDVNVRNRLQSVADLPLPQRAERLGNVVTDFCLKTMKVTRYDQSFLFCSNAAEIVAANPDIKNPVTFTGEVEIPFAAKVGAIDTGTAPVPLATSAVASHTPVTGLRERQPALRFVTELNDLRGYEPACANSEKIKHGTWPFDVGEFERALNISDLKSAKRPGKILIVDSGFDFSEGASADDASIKDAFPPDYFYKLPRDSDPPDQEGDQNGDGVAANGGWAGVNLAEHKRGSPLGSRSSETSAAYDHRSHGLTVTTIALGGFGIAELRKTAALPIRIGEVSLVPIDAMNPTLDNLAVENSIQFATARDNNFDIINFSLSAPASIPELNRLVSDRSKHLVLIVAAGNDGRQLSLRNGVWPAVLGGMSTSGDSFASAFITVGAHDALGAWAQFSNWGSGVDILAPGCAVPAYELKTNKDGEVLGIQPTLATGTSIAAPLVSFVAALLVSSPVFAQRPGDVKNRIQVGSDYDYSLQQRAVSSGRLNLAKAIAFKYDLVEVNDEGRPTTNGTFAHKLRYGTITPRSDTSLRCGFDAPIPFSSIKKIARGQKADEPVLVLSAEDLTKPAILNRHFCPPNALDGLEYDFQDVETKEKLILKANEVWDYIAKQ